MLVKIKSYEEIRKTLNWNDNDNTNLPYNLMMKNLCGKTINVTKIKNKKWYITKPSLARGKKYNQGWTFSTNWFDFLPQQLELEF